MTRWTTYDGGRMKALPWVLCVLAVLGLIASNRPVPKDGRLAIAQAELAQLTVSRDSFAHAVKELQDSLDGRLHDAHAGQDAARRLAAVDSLLRKTADSLAGEAVTAHDWQMAYVARTTEADTLRRALNIAQGALNDALAAAAFAQLMHLADSSRIARYESAVPVVLAASKPSFWTNRVVVSIGYSATKASDRVVAGPSVQVGVRVWPL